MVVFYGFVVNFWALVRGIYVLSFPRARPRLAEPKSTSPQPLAQDRLPLQDKAAFYSTFCHLSSTQAAQSTSSFQDGPFIYSYPKPPVGVIVLHGPVADCKTRGKTRLAKWYAPYSV
jgi:hypothetical protein